MKTLLRASLAAAIAALAVGCQSSRTARIDEHAALFATLDPATQKLIREGLFAPGFTPQLTYMALGKPNHVEKRDTEHGAVEIWKYRNFVYAGTAAVQMMPNTPGSTRSHGPLLSPNAPGGPSLFSTKPGPMQPSVGDGSGAPVGNLYLEFLNGRVVAARLEP